MTDFILGAIFALAVYAFVTLLFKDIVVKSFIGKLIEGSRLHAPGEPALDKEIFTKEVINDILTSYRLLLIIKNEFTYLLKYEGLILNKDITENDFKMICKVKLKQCEEAIEQTEEMFKDQGIEEYKAIKKEIEELMANVFYTN